MSVHLEEAPETVVSEGHRGKSVTFEKTEASPAHIFWEGGDGAPVIEAIETDLDWKTVHDGTTITVGLGREDAITECVELMKAHDAGISEEAPDGTELPGSVGDWDLHAFHRDNGVRYRLGRKPDVAERFEPYSHLFDDAEVAVRMFPALTHWAEATWIVEKAYLGDEIRQTTRTGTPRTYESFGAAFDIALRRMR